MAVHIVSSREHGGSSRGTQRSCSAGKVLEQRRGEGGQRQRLELGTETTIGAPPCSLSCRQLTAAFYLEEIPPDVFSDSGKSLNLSVKLKRQALCYVAAA